MKLHIRIFLFLFLTYSSTIFSQEDTGSESKKYILKDLEIQGTTKYSKSQILRFTGLIIGESIEIPSQKINSAIKKLWRSNLFSDVEIFIEDIEKDMVTLKVNLVALNELEKINFTGKIGKGKQDKFKKEANIKDGMKITEDLKNKLQHNIINFYNDKGFPDSKVTFSENINQENNKVTWNVNVDKGNRIKVDNINIQGNKDLSGSKLRSKVFKNTKQVSILNIFKSSKYNNKKFQEDLDKLVQEYKSHGFRDAKVVNTSITRPENKNYKIDVTIEEGKKYYLGNVNFIGNTAFSTDILNRILGYKKGETYDAVGINNKITGADNKDNDVNSLYHNDGYLFARVIPIEKGVRNDSIDVDVLISEGAQATWNKVTFTGNITTYDHVIQRTLRTQPGELFSKADVKRTYFELASMPFIEAQKIGQDIVPNQETNTVDINWNLTEKGSSQVQLQGGYGGGRFIGTLGLSFGNFSLKNILKKDKWRPIPSGDGQTLSLQAQAGSNYQNYSVSFVEPWIGGKKPTSLSVTFYNTRLNYPSTAFNNTIQPAQKLNILGTSVGLNKLLTWPDDWFRLSQALTFQVYNYNNYPFININNLTLQNGNSNNFNYTISLSRNSQGTDPIFPDQGSEFDLSLKLTPPYSLFSNKDYTNMDPERKYKWVEYYKIKFKGYWYQKFIQKSVIKIGGEMGFLKGYNDQIGDPPFERFFIGGTGLAGNRFDGREIIPLRGYQDATNSGAVPGRDITPRGGGSIYNKFMMELRYPITLGESAKIYGLSFLEAGNTWTDNKDFNPFQLKKSVGMGVRIFMPAFGLLGFDFAYGFDKTLNTNRISGWQTHFIIGQQF